MSGAPTFAVGEGVQKRHDHTFIGVVVLEDDDPEFLWVAWGMRPGDPIHGDKHFNRQKIARRTLRAYPVPEGEE